MASSKVGVVAYGIYLPETFMTAAEVARASNGQWTEAAVREKLGFDRKTIPGPDDGTQAMGVRAALDCLRRFDYDPARI
ncbi:MAG: fabH 5, partial [bacterium]|nr:fabH 5 [bacterium]